MVPLAIVMSLKNKPPDATINVRQQLWLACKAKPTARPQRVPELCPGVSRQVSRQSLATRAHDQSTIQSIDGFDAGLARSDATEFESRNAIEIIDYA